MCLWFFTFQGNRNSVAVYIELRETALAYHVSTTFFLNICVAFCLLGLIDGSV